MVEEGGDEEELKEHRKNRRLGLVLCNRLDELYNRTVSHRRPSVYVGDVDAYPCSPPRCC
jgi:hypothetical protein